jgi:hypothetical protein
MSGQKRTAQRGRPLFFFSVRKIQIPNPIIPE